MERIVGGNVSHITGTTTKYQIERFKLWWRKDPIRATDDIMAMPSSDGKTLPSSDGKTLPSSQQSDNPTVVLALNKPIPLREAISFLVTKFKLSKICIVFLGYLHDDIAKNIIKVVNESGKQINRVSDTHPHNYTSAMSEIRNMRFDNYDHTKFQGFCPCEPLVRIQQLLSFPIEQFGAPSTSLKPLGELPPPPAIASDTIQFNSRREIYDFIVGNEKKLSEWENYYTELAKVISNSLTTV